MSNWEAVLRQIGVKGTNITQNRNDPTGDGDQSLITNAQNAQFLRNVWSEGGDIYDLVPRG